MNCNSKRSRLDRPGSRHESRAENSGDAVWLLPALRAASLVDRNI
jgi:hypothetical protein